jgi:hypothetical protein
MLNQKSNSGGEAKSYWVWAQRRTDDNGILLQQQIVTASDSQEAMAEAWDSLSDPDHWVIVFSGPIQFIAKLLQRMKEQSSMDAQLGLKHFLVIIEDSHENMRHPGTIPASNIHEACASVLKQFRSGLGLTPDQDKDRCRVVGAIEYSVLAKTYLAILAV